MNTTFAMISIFGYRIQILLIILIVLVPILIIFGVLFLKKIIIKKDGVLGNRITNWQKKHLLETLGNQIIISEKQNPDNKAAIHLLSAARTYIIEHEYWYTTDLLAIDERLILFLSTIVFYKAKEKFVEGDYNSTVLYLHSLDVINGGSKDKQNEWIGDEIEAVEIHKDMDDSESRMLRICYNAVSLVINSISIEEEFLPLSDFAPDALKEVSRAELSDALNELSETIDTREVDQDLMPIIANCLIRQIDNGIRLEEQNQIRPIVLYSIRSLASLIDGQLYDEVLSTIDF